jgi:hypothetical protein
VEHADESARGGAPNRLQVTIHVLVEAGVAQKDLDAAATVLQQVGDVVQSPLIRLNQHRMKKLRLRWPALGNGCLVAEGLQWRFAGRAERHVANGGDSARQRRRQSGLKVVHHPVGADPG